MGNTTAKRPVDEQQNPGDVSVSSSIVVGSPMDDSGFIFPDHHDLLTVSVVEFWDEK